jgi:hypothetical protein
MGPARKVILSVYVPAIAGNAYKTGMNDFTMGCRIIGHKIVDKLCIQFPQPLHVTFVLTPGVKYY